MFVGRAEVGVAVPEEVELRLLAERIVSVAEAVVMVVPLVVIVWFWADIVLEALSVPEASVRLADASSRLMADAYD